MSEPPIVDAHNDLLLELEHRRGEENPFARYWLGNLERGNVILQVCPIFGADLEALPELILRRNLRQVQAFKRAVRENRERMIEVRSRGDLDAVERGDRLGLMLSIEGVEALGYDPTLIDVFFELGVRMVSLTWNRRNAFADGAAEDPRGGLSRLGRELVARMVELGVILDLVHASEATFWEVLAISGTAPVVVSHGACRTVCETPRNLSDDQLRALAERGGVLGVMQLPIVVDPDRWELTRVVDHFDHAVEVMGIDHVGFGADFIVQTAHATGLVTPADALLPGSMPIDAAIDGLAGPEDFSNLIAALRERGYEDERLAAITARNFLRLFRQALPAG